MSQKRHLSFHERTKAIIKKIPRGRVATYGQIAALAGQPRAARQVAWVLHSASDSDKLPWQRVINRSGTISLPRHGGYELQRGLLEQEGIEFDHHERIDFKKYQWRPRRKRF